MKSYWFWVGLCVWFSSCLSPKSGSQVMADLEPLHATQELTTEEYRGLRAGGIENTKRQAIIRHRLEISLADQGLEIQTQADSAYLEFVPSLINLPKDWETYSDVSITLSNRSERPVSLVVKLFHVRGFVPFSLEIPGTETKTWKIPVAELALVSRGKRMYEPSALRLEVYAPNQPAILNISALSLIPSGDPNPAACADQFGQRIRGTWPGKITTESQLKEHAEAERKRYTTVADAPERNPYGGWTAGPQFEGTGFFRLEKGKTVKGITHWWLVDPLGHPFWSLGVTGVRPKYPASQSELAIYGGREFLFDELPPRSEAFGEVYIDDRVSLYAWNLIRKWGNLDAWREIAPKRLKSWGLNTLGNWSDAGVIGQSQMTYTWFLRSNDDMSLRLGDSRLADVFDPKWEQALDSAFSSISERKDDPHLLGYFVDNEQSWGSLRLLERASPESATRKGWLDLIQQSYQTVSAVNQAWNTDFDSWEAIKAISKPPEGVSAQFSRDMLELESQYADRYFRIIAQTLKKHDPNHLYLGCRFTKRVKPAHVVAAAGRYCDVITINNYSLVPTRERMEKWHRLSGGRPILIGEHHLPLKSERQLPPRYQNFSPQERLKYYQAYEKGWAEMPFSVGSHWYQHVDQPLTGRASDGENQTVGLLDITDQPHAELVEAIGEVSKMMYEWHRDKR